VKEDLDAFVGEAPQFDDITMLCLEYKSKMEAKGVVQ
jgi:sigma-B regulation protein RsbU (phosphoserine phosphatase)